MPKETFLKLPNEKKEKIIKAAQKEFERVPIEEVSIKNIVENAVQQDIQEQKALKEKRQMEQGKLCTIRYSF